MHHVHKRQHDAYEKQKRFHMFDSVMPKIDDSSTHRSSGPKNKRLVNFCSFTGSVLPTRRRHNTGKTETRLVDGRKDGWL